MKKKMVVGLLCITMMFGMVSCKDDRDMVPTVEPPKVSNISDGVASVKCDSIIRLSMPVEGSRVYYSIDGTSYKKYEQKTGIALSAINGLSDSISLSFYAEKDGMNRSDVVKKVYEVVHRLEACYEWEKTSDGYGCTASMKCPAHANVVGVVEIVASTSKAVVREPSCTENGTTRYTCVFTGKGYEDQTKDVDDVPMTPHSYDAELAEDRYQKSEATCTAKAVYYKSCSTCGERSSDATFEHGDVIGHDYSRELAEDGYLKSEATCTDKAVYFKSCSMCGGKSPDATFECGEALGHGYSSGYSYDEEFHWMTCNRCSVDSKGSGIIPNDRHVYDSDVAEDRYLKSKATYTDRAVYYKSCSVCGASSNSDDYTFEYGETLVSETVLDNIVIRIEDGTAAVLRVVDSKIANWECVIPETFDDVSITGISPNAFSGCSGLASVTIPDSVTSIGKEAFDGCNNLSEIHAESFTKDEWRSMSKDADIRSYATIYLKYGARDGKIVEDGITYLVRSDGTRYVADADESITTAVIPCEVEGDSVTYIGYRAFKGCTSLTSVTIPDSVTLIGDYAFSSCKNLTSMAIPDSMTYIGNSVFMDCTSLTSVAIPDSVTVIGDSAFRDCSSLTSVTIPGSVSFICTRAFFGCENLDEIHAESFTKDAWRSMSKDASIPSEATVYLKDRARDGRIVEGGITYLVRSDGTRYVSDADESITTAEVRSEVEGESVTTIGVKAFKHCTSLTSVTIPDSVTAIRNSAFEDCTSLTSVAIPDSVTAIGNSAFEYCISLTSVTIPGSVTSIGGIAFSHCKNLKSVTIGNSVTTIGENAFSNCTSLTSVTIPNSVTSIGNYAFYNCDKLTEIRIDRPKGSISGAPWGAPNATVKWKGEF